MARPRDEISIACGLVRALLGVATVVASASPALTQDRPRDYDASRDINMRTGRIPRGYRPTDLLHPERWRYEPEQRLESGSMVDRFLLTTFGHFPVKRRIETGHFLPGCAGFYVFKKG